MGENGHVGLIVIDKCLKIIGGSWQKALIGAAKSHEVL